jgi:hypothetical protein
LTTLNTYAWTSFDYYFPSIKKIEIQHYDIPFSEFSNFELRLEIVNGKTCAVFYKDLSTEGCFVPFERFLTAHESCFNNFVPVETLQRTLSTGSIDHVVDMTTQLILDSDRGSSIIRDCGLLLLENNLISPETVDALDMALSHFF